MLDEASVRRHLRMADLIPAMARALVDLSAGRSVQPARQMLQVPGRDGFFAVMPAFAAGALGAKLVTFFPGNTGIHTHHALILLFQPETGEPLATMDGRLITEMRTAAVSAVATQWLARPDAGILAILGSGRAGTEPPRGAPAGASARRGSGVEPEERRRVRRAPRHSRGERRPRRRSAAPTW